jgi:hypothetical protein
MEEGRLNITSIYSKLFEILNKATDYKRERIVAYFLDISNKAALKAALFVAFILWG